MILWPYLAIEKPRAGSFCIQYPLLHVAPWCVEIIMQWSFLSEYESVCYRAADGSGTAELEVDVRGGEEALVAILSLSLCNFVKEKKKRLSVTLLRKCSSESALREVCVCPALSRVCETLSFWYKSWGYNFYTWIYLPSLHFSIPFCKVLFLYLKNVFSQCKAAFRFILLHC